MGVLQTSPQKEVFASPRAGTVSSDSSFATEVSTTNLHEWLLRRADELQVEFDREVLWFTLNEIDWTSGWDANTVKMWLGFSPDDELPKNTWKLIVEFRKQCAGR